MNSGGIVSIKELLFYYSHLKDPILSGGKDQILTQHMNDLLLAEIQIISKPFFAIAILARRKITMHQQMIVFLLELQVL